MGTRRNPKSRLASTRATGRTAAATVKVPSSTPTAIFTQAGRFGEKEGTATYKSKATGMKMQGEWKDGEIQTGRWIYPNGVYYEGTFANNKPDGSGTWNFNNGNSLQGVYTQKPAVAEEEDGGEDEDGAAKKRFDLVWQADTKISDSAFKVNSVEN